MQEQDAAIIAAAIAELERARRLYPSWPDNPVEAAAVVTEEAGEVVKAVNNYRWKQGDDMPSDIWIEGIQHIAMAIRFLADTPLFQEPNGFSKDASINRPAVVMSDEFEAWAGQQGATE